MDDSIDILAKSAPNTPRLKAKKKKGKIFSKHSVDVVMLKGGKNNAPLSPRTALQYSHTDDTGSDDHNDSVESPKFSENKSKKSIDLIINNNELYDIKDNNNIVVDEFFDETEPISPLMENIPKQPRLSKRSRSRSISYQNHDELNNPSTIVCNIYYQHNII